MIQNIQIKQQTYNPIKNSDISFKSEKIDFEKEARKKKFNAFLLNTGVAGAFGVGTWLLYAICGKKNPNIRARANITGIRTFFLTDLILGLMTELKNEQKAQEAISKFNLDTDKFSPSSMFQEMPEAMDFNDEELNKQYYSQSLEKSKIDSKAIPFIAGTGIITLVFSLILSLIKKDDEAMTKAMGAGAISAAAASVLAVLNSEYKNQNQD